MRELIEKRHLAPIYGERTPLASEYEDHLVIEEIPDIFHTGHVHINSYKKHKGIHMINSGTFPVPNRISEDIQYNANMCRGTGSK